MKMIRNFQFEHDILTASAVDLAIANSLNNPNSLCEIMQVVECDGHAVTADGLLKFHNDRQQQFLPPNFSSKISYENFALLSQHTGTQVTQIVGGIETVVNVSSIFRALRLSTYPTLIPYGREAFAMDIQHARGLVQTLKLTLGWDQSIGNREAVWKESNELLPDSATFKAYDINGNISFQFMVVTDYVKSYAVLPVVLYRHLEVQYPYIGFSPPNFRCAFLNEQHLTQFPNATVILTPNIVSALLTAPTEDRIVLANIGYESWLNKLSFDVLKERRLVLVDEDGLHKGYTLKLLEKLHLNNIAVSHIQQSLPQPLPIPQQYGGIE